MPFPSAHEIELPGGVEAAVIDLGDGDAPTVQLTAPDEPLTMADLDRLSERLRSLVGDLAYSGLSPAVGA